MGILFLSQNICLSAQPVANFSSDKTSDCVPAVIQFYDLSSGNPTSWFWDFGNGNTSVLQNPGAFYVNPGSYTVKLIVSNAFGNDSIVKPYYIKAYSPPVCNFHTADTIGCAPYTVSFTDLSFPQSIVITNWFWNFGDGGYSTLQNPVHTYNSGGNYTVYLIIKDANGCQNSYFINNYIEVHQPKADFSAAINGCAPPASVSFTDTSIGTGLSYLWDFGDGATSTVADPAHIFNSADTFNISLIITDNIGCSDTSIQDLIVQNHQADFNYSVSCLNDSSYIIYFTDMSSPSPYSWLWDFGDGDSTDTNNNPSHLYNSTQSYTITLISAIGNGCIDTAIKVYAPPHADFLVDSFSCSSPFQVNFTDISTGTGPLSYFWFFDDNNNTSTAQNPTYIYSVSEEVEFKYYHVLLVVTNPFGCVDTARVRISIIKPYAKFEAVPFEGCIPLDVQFTDESISRDTIISWFWDFGDGYTSVLQNPSYIYPDTGRYTVTLIINTVNGCTDTLISTDYIKAGIKPDFIDFTIDTAIGCHQSVFSVDTLCFHHLYQFLDLSGFYDTTIHVNNWGWSFAYYPSCNMMCPDTSTEQNPFFDTGHIPLGADTILLIAGFNGCNDTIYKRIWNEPPVSYICFLQADSTPWPACCVCPVLASCSSPFTLGLYNCSILYDSVIAFQVTDLQTGQITSLDFYDTTFITFNKAGHYQFYIETKNDTSKLGGCGDCNPHFMLTVDSVLYGFSTFPDTACKGMAFAFKDTTVSFYGELRQWYWDFGDGDTLRIDTVSYAIYYDTLEYIPHADDTIFPVQIEGSDTILLQDFNHDGNHEGRTTGTYRNPVHTYEHSGTYIVKSIVTVDVLYWCCGSAKWDTLKCFYFSYDTVHVINEKGIEADFIAAPTYTCPGDTVFFTDSTISNFPIVHWIWDFGDSSSFDTIKNPLHIFTTPGIYTIALIVENPYGCMDTIIKNQYIHVMPVVDFYAVNVETCVGDSIYFINNSQGNGLSYLWDFGDGFTDTLINPIHIYDSAGVFNIILMITDSMGCSNIKTLNNYIIINNKPISAFGANSIWANCPPLPVVFLDSSSSDVTQWQWDFGDGYTSVQQNAGHLYTTSGNFDVQLIVTNIKGCSDTLIKNEYIHIGGPSGTFSFEPDSSCIPGTVIFIANDTNTDYFFWDFGDGYVNFLTTADNGDSTVHTYNTPGIYLPGIILTDSGGCDFTVPSAQYVYIDNVFADFYFGDTILCDTGDVFFNNLTSFFFPVSYLWLFGDGGSSTLTSPLHYFDSSGTYLITLSAVSTLGCSSSVTKTITIYKAPEIIFSPHDTSGCIPLNLTFTGSNTDTLVFINSWLWNFGDGTFSPDYTINHTYNNQGNYLVNLTVAYGDSICILDTIIHIDAYNWTVADFIYNPTNPSLVNPIVVFQDQSTNVVSWYWNFGDGNVSTVQNPVNIYQQSGSYIITLITSNDAGCPDTTNKTIYVSPKDLIKFPDAFTPNGDGSNDEFLPFYSGSFDWIEFRIFNRWGEMVFETTDITQGWDGTFKGEPQQEATFSYYILAKPTNSENTCLIKGTVTLVR
ncbi:MAG: PKD domain-containing protein [Bacteroidota bacterium]